MFDLGVLEITPTVWHGIAIIAHGMVWYCHYYPRASIAIIAHGPEGPTGNNEAMLAHG